MESDAVMGTVICQSCGKPAKEWVFNKDLKPVCMVCIDRTKTMKAIVSVKEAELKTIFNDDGQSELTQFIK